MVKQAIGFCDDCIQGQLNPAAHILWESHGTL
jgi:hypothetical protein